MIPPWAHYAVFAGWRYSFTRKRNRFTGVIALVSLLGMVLGVASLITVLSVMNGFGDELRSRILALVPHGYLELTSDSAGDWQSLRENMLERPGITGAAPYVSEKVVLGLRGVNRGAVLTGINPALQAGVSELHKHVVSGSLDNLTEGSYAVFLGEVLARMLGALPGDSIRVTVPRLTVTPLGLFPVTRRLTVAGVFEVGAQQDGYQAYMGLADAVRLLRDDGAVDGLQLSTADLMSAPAVLRDARHDLPGETRLRDWTETQGSLFRAMHMEKLTVGLMLFSVILVAAFNIISLLAMSVAEKRRDIAVLRTMGAQRGGVMLIFLVHGLSLAVAGISLGVAVGVPLAIHAGDILDILERLAGFALFDPSVYFITGLPSSLEVADVLAVVTAALTVSILASLYPAWRAAQLVPAEVLRNE